MFDKRRIETIQRLGFDDERDLARHIIDVDLSSNEKLKAFAQWKHDDGTKVGLLALSKPLSLIDEAKEFVVVVEQSLAVPVDAACTVAMINKLIARVEELESGVPHPSDS